MTNSMIPFSFIPGTKAKSSEVNANFIALTQLINNNKDATNIDFEKVYKNIALKADKTELINEFEITNPETDLNDYKTKGLYIFSALYTPTNIPRGDAGTLFVNGVENSNIKQFWMCDDTNEIYQREFSNEQWSEWQSLYGNFMTGNPGYITFPNGLILQWGSGYISVVTYPIAYTTAAFPVFTKLGYAANYERSDTGIISSKLTGLEVGSCGLYQGMHWVVIGY